MAPPVTTTTSKFLSLVLRHRPELLGLELDAGGWVLVDELLARLAAHGQPLTRALLEQIVTTSPKQRFAISADGRSIRAQQGHSIPVELGYSVLVPPQLLYHGTIERAWHSIRVRGLERMQRHHVHLSDDPDSARSVGARRGKPVLLEIDAGGMERAGHVFWRTDNGVWLTEAVPPEYIRAIS